MGKLEYTIEVKAPLEKVFNFIADGTNSPKWHPTIRSVERISEGPLQVGSRLRVEAVLSGRRNVWDQEVVEFTPNRSFRDRLIAGSLRKFEDWANFEKTETGTQWTFGLDYELSGTIFYRILDILVVRRRIRQYHLEAMKRAKEILERQ
jgi:uncharacterized membrane protein